MQGGSHREMMGLIHKLFDNRDLIKRSYNKTNIGIESYTRSDDPQVGEWIQTHVYQMETLMESNNEGIMLMDDMDV